jgi:hypothetical protein
LLAGALLTGCAVVRSPVGHDAIVTSVNGPVAMTEHVGSQKKGGTCAWDMLGLFVTEDGSIEKARRKAGIEKVSSVVELQSRLTRKLR